MDNKHGDLFEQDLAAMIYNESARGGVGGVSRAPLLAEPNMATTVLRSLSEAARLTVFRMLPVETGVKVQSLTLWFGGNSVRAQEVATLLVERGLFIQKKVTVPGQSQQPPITLLSLEPYWRKGLEIALQSRKREDRGALTLNPSDAVNAGPHTLFNLQLTSFLAWTNLLRWLTADAVGIWLWKQDGHEAKMEYSSVALMSGSAWAGTPIRPPPPILAAAFGPLLRVERTPRGHDMNLNMIRWMFQGSQKRLSIPLSLLIKTILQGERDDSGQLDALLTLFLSISHMKIGELCDFQEKMQQDLPTEHFVTSLVYMGLLAVIPIGTGERVAYAITPLTKLVLGSELSVDLFALPMATPHLRACQIQAIEPFCVDVPSRYGVRTDDSGKVITPRPPRAQREALSMWQCLQRTSELISHTDQGMVVESNFKLFLYTSSNLLLSLVSHFSQLKIITPSLCCALLTRKSIHHAFSLGLRSETIIEFFDRNAHSAQAAVLSMPTNVRIQIEMWDLERRRITMKDALLLHFDQEVDIDMFPPAWDWVKRKGYLLTATVGPTDLNKNSDSYHEWRNDVIREMRLRQRHGDKLTAANAFTHKQLAPGQISASPCLAVLRQHGKAVIAMLRMVKSKRDVEGA